MVLCGSARWDGPRLGSHFLAEALARHAPVLYVDPPERHRIRPELQRAGDRLARLRPPAPPGKDRRGVLALTQAAFRASLKQAVRALNAEDDVQAVISGPVKYDPFGAVGERRRIFRASDDFAAGARLTPLSTRRLTALEQRLARKAGIVVCASPVLVEKWRALGHDPVFIPNGCDAAFLRGATASATTPAADVDLPTPIAGYLGQLSTRIDLALLHAVADDGLSLLLVGGRRADLSERELHALTDRPNVQWVGARPFEELLPYLAAMQVGLVPYTLSEFNRASFPLKTLEYLAAGLPVVSTNLPATRWLDTPLATIADDHATFVAAVRAAATIPSSADERQRFAAAHSWESRAADYLKLVTTASMP